MTVEKNTLFYLTCLNFQLSIFGQNVSKSDSVFYDTLNPKFKLVYELIADGDYSYYYTSYRNSAKRRQTRSIYLDGTKRSRGSCNMFRTLKTKIWTSREDLLKNPNSDRLFRQHIHGLHGKKHTT